MGLRTENEPPYPQTQAELEDYCNRLITSLREHLGDRLKCVLLCGSWARGEAKPPDSDVDLAVVIDTVDGQAMDQLRESWLEAEVGYANVYGADEVPVMSRIAAAMYTTNAVVLYGHNPFARPTKADLAEEVALAAEQLARSARSLELAYWQTQDQRSRDLDNLLAKWGIKQAFETVVGFRTGEYPRNQTDLELKLAGTPEGDFWKWMDVLSSEAKGQNIDAIARHVTLLARDWFHEIAPYRQVAKAE